MKKKLLFGFMAVMLVASTILVGCVAPAPEKEAPAVEMKPTVWHTQTCTPKGHRNANFMDMFAEGVEKRTNGLLKIEVYYTSALGIPTSKQISAVRDGLIELGEQVAPAVYGECPYLGPAELWGLVPWDLEVHMLVDDALKSIYEKLLPEKYNQYFLGCCMDDYGTIVFRDKKVETLDDLKGLKIRVSGATMADTIRLLGASPTSISGAELLEAMATGVMDGCMSANSWFGSVKFYELCKYGYEPYMGCHQNSWTVNKQAFDALTPEVQKILVEEVDKAMLWQWHDVDKSFNEGKQIMIEGGVQYFDMTPEDTETTKKLCAPVIDQWVEEGGPLSAEIIDIVRSVVADWEAKQK